MRKSIYMVAILAVASADPASARTHHPKPKVRFAPASLPADAYELGKLAPPTRLETLEQNYGDAEIARLGMQRRIAKEGSGDDVHPFAPCDPRNATPDAYRCRENARLRYGQAYAVLPSYVSSPTVVAQDPRVQAPVTPPVTSFLFGLNELAFGNPAQ